MIKRLLILSLSMLTIQAADKWFTRKDEIPKPPKLQREDSRQWEHQLEEEDKRAKARPITIPPAHILRSLKRTVSIYPDERAQDLDLRSHRTRPLSGGTVQERPWCLSFACCCCRER